MLSLNVKFSSYCNERDFVWGHLSKRFEHFKIFLLQTKFDNKIDSRLSRFLGLYLTSNIVDIKCTWSRWRDCFKTLKRLFSSPFESGIMLRMSQYKNCFLQIFEKSLCFKHMHVIHKHCSLNYFTLKAKQNIYSILLYRKP